MASLKLVDISVFNFGATLENWKLLKSLKTEVLFKDKYWHFFWEGDHVSIRCPLRRAPKVVKWFKNHLIKCSMSPYMDNIRITRKYQEEFITMFHSFSELAFKMDPEDLPKILERINHCFMNPVCMNFFEALDDPFWEAKQICNVALQRVSCIEISRK